ncbi:hypothetical protein D3C87_1069830 [compost metagenome]
MKNPFYQRETELGGVACDAVRYSLPGVFRWCRVNSRVNASCLFGGHYISLGEGTGVTAHGYLLGFTYMEVGDKATLRGPGFLWERVGFCTCVRLGSVFVYRRIGGVSTFRPSLKFF